MGRRLVLSFMISRPKNSWIVTMLRSAIAVSFLLACLQTTASATIIRLDNTGGGVNGLGVLLDELQTSDIGTATATVNVPGFAGLTITLTGLATAVPSSAPILNSTGTSLGINASGDSNTERFESEFSQSATFQFNQAVEVSQLDFTAFESGDKFSFFGTTISNGDLSNGTTDIFDFSTPLTIAANTNFSLSATAGTVGIEALDIALATAVPEPSHLVLITMLGISVVVGRRRRLAKQQVA